MLELASFMRDLGCERALNLDGGGSTTMWVRGEPEGGIVNYPCDNRKHDRKGMRRVPNAVVVHARDIIMGATEEADLHPAEEWRKRGDGRGIHGRGHDIPIRNPGGDRKRSSPGRAIGRSTATNKFAIRLANFSKL